MELKIILGVLPIVLGVGISGFYIREVLLERIKPHAFTWLIWGVTTGIAFAAQLTNDGGAGAWFTGFTSAACFVIFLLSLRKGDRSFPLFDWTSLLIALFSIIPWLVTKNAIISVLLVTFIDMCRYFPILRKIITNPREESLPYFSLSIVQYLSSILALSSINLTTALYPFMCIAMNTIVVGMILMVRKKQRTSPVT